MLDQIDFSLFESQSKMEQEINQETKDLETLLKTFTEGDETQQDQNYSQDNNVVPKKRRSDYSNTKVKARNLLTNVAYRCFKQSDFSNSSFVIDISSFKLQNCNPINLEIKLETEKEREMIKFMWDTCIPHDFVTAILKQSNYNIVSQTNLAYQKANTIVTNYLKEDESRLAHLKYKMAEKLI